MIFFVLFIVTIAVYTAFQNMLVVSIFFALIGILAVIYQLLSGKKIYTKKTIPIIMLAIGGALCACAIKERRYAHMEQIPDSLTSYIGSGIIRDTLGEGKYIFTTSYGEYMLYSEQSYHIGMQLWMVGNIQPNTAINPLRQRTISSGTFTRPLFSGSFDRPSRLKMKGWKGSIYETNALITMRESPDTPVFMRIKEQMRQRVIATYGNNAHAGLLLGMLIGDKSYIPQESYQSFIDSGLVHLIAVSGGNILMIVVFLQYILCRIPFYPRIAIIIGVIVGYGILCGMDSSVFRAVIMGGMSMLALFWGREIPIWKLLSGSALLMLAINPYFLLYDTGFLLSYSALIGIVCFQQVTAPQGGAQKKSLHRGKKSLVYVYKNYILPSIGASIGIFPIIIFFMGKINLVSILGNILILPLVPFVMIYGGISVMVAVVWSWQGIEYIEHFLLQYIYVISDVLSAYGIYLSVSGLRVKYVICIVFGGLFVWWYKNHRKAVSEVVSSKNHTEDVGYLGKVLENHQQDGSTI